jgi:hypothetical protein
MDNTVIRQVMDEMYLLGKSDAHCFELPNEAKNATDFEDVLTKKRKHMI